MNVMNHDRRSAKASAWARARLLGTSSPNTIVNRLSTSVTMIRASASPS